MVMEWIGMGSKQYSLCVFSWYTTSTATTPIYIKGNN